jgi:hypothetical protein
MIKCLYVNGDSFSFGQELGMKEPWYAETTILDFTPYHRKNCYSGIIADTLQVEEYINNSRPSGSNEQAYRCVITDVSELLKKYKPEEIFVTVSLSSPLRREFWRLDREEWWAYITSHEPPKVDPVIHDFWDMFTRNFSGDIGFYNFDTMMVLGIQNFLIKNKIPYLLTSSMNNIYEDEIKNNTISKDLLDQVYEHRCFMNPSFMIFNRDVKQGIGPRLHPLEGGHRLWAEYLLEYIKNHNLLDNRDLP